MSGVNLERDIQVSDILAVRTEGLGSELIRFGEALHDQPNLENHIAVVHHKNGNEWRCIEARPGGVAWADARPYLNNHWTMSNVGQEKTTAQRDGVTLIMEQMLKTNYDWDAIAQDALIDLHIPDVWAEKWGNSTPDHVVCSSLAAWGYGKQDLARPTPSDPAHVQPADWTEWIIVNGYQNPAKAV
jgi:hypothetical protein